MEEEGPWLDPHHLRKKGKDKVYNKVQKENITKFFISNLPIGCRPWDVADFVGQFGEVAGMYIARKMDKEGRRFGFLSLRNVKDARATERVLNGLKMGGFCLWVNIAKFAAENVDWWDGDAHSNKAGKTDSVNEKKPRGNADIYNGRGFNEGKLRDGLSYKDMVKQGSSGSRMESNEKEVVVHNETSAFFDLQGRAVIGRVVDLLSLRKMHVLLKEAGVSYFKIQYLGGLSLMISFEDDIEAADFLLDVDKWRRWFSSLDM
ncbi:putative RNA recognition motif domain, nucleotide-binding alpha-beta plait domain superfamily [Helianthus annuus]|nr:putative RNA recognition motif domain, nucleotide-binding alpha-beta plait domain superfamily [Helianthus annuus]